MVGAGAHHDHRAPLGALGVAGELAGDLGHHAGVDAGDRLLPGGGEGPAGVVVTARPAARQPVAAHPELGAEEVEDGGHPGIGDPPHGHAAAQRLACFAVEVGQRHLEQLLVVAVERERRVDAAQLQVPAPLPRLAPAVADRAPRGDRTGRDGVEDGRLPLRVLGLGAEVGVAQEAPRHQVPVALLEADQEGQVGEAGDVVGEVGHPALDVELLQDHVRHRHRQGAVGAGRRGQPVVGELGVVGVVGGDDDGLLTAVAGLGHEVRVGRTRHRDVGAPHHQVAGVPPVGRLGHVGLVAPDLRRGGRQVGVPVVEREADPADQREEAGAGGVGGHRHRRDRREAGDPVGPVALDRVHVGGGDQLAHLLPGRTDEAAFAALGGVGRVAGDRRPGVDRVVVARPRGAPELQQRPAHVGVLHPQRRVGVPGEGGAARAAAGLVVGGLGAVGGVVGLLGLPGDDPVLDVDLPRAGAGAVDPVRGADDFGVLPAVPVGALPGARAAAAGAPGQVGVEAADRREVSELVER